MELRNKDKIRMAGVTMTVVNDTYSVYVFSTEDCHVVTIDKVLLDEMDIVRVHNIPTKNRAVIRLIGDDLNWRVFERDDEGYWRATDRDGSVVTRNDHQIQSWIDEARGFEVLYEGDNE